MEKDVLVTQDMLYFDILNAQYGGGQYHDRDPKVNQLEKEIKDLKKNIEVLHSVPEHDEDSIKTLKRYNLI